MDATEAGLLVGLAGLWGSSFFFYKVLDSALPPLTIVLGRLALAALVLNLVLAARGQRLSAASPWGSLAVLGALNSVVPFSLFAWGETQVSSGMAAMLNAVTPAFSVLLAHWLTRTEALTWPRALGVLAGLLGVAVLIGPAAWRGGGLWGDAACVAASFSYAVAGQFARRLHHLPPLQVATGQLTAGALLVLPLAVVFDRFWTLPDPPAGVWASLAGIAVLCTALAYTMFYRLIATAGATNALLVTFLQPIGALLLGWLFLGETVPGRALAGMALVGAGLVAIDGRLLRKQEST